jgi:hypothetical protein
MPRRKDKDDEMLVTHKPAESKEMSERTGTDERAAAEREVDPNVLVARLAATVDPAERAKLMAEIQVRLGNQEAERIIRSIQVAGES